VGKPVGSGSPPPIAPPAGKLRHARTRPRPEEDLLSCVGKLRAGSGDLQPPRWQAPPAPTPPLPLRIAAPPQPHRALHHRIMPLLRCASSRSTAVALALVCMGGRIGEAEDASVQFFY